MIRQVRVTRYIQPLREGGSLPALAEADDDFKYVLKFRGTGHGVKTLIAEYIGAELARLLDLHVPEIVFADLDEAFGRTEADEEIQDLLKASQGLNLGMHFLSGAVTFDPAIHKLDAETASRIVWLDNFITNVDRSFRNTNLLIWNRNVWLIDHGSCLYFQYTWEGWQEKSTADFGFIKDHVLLPVATALPAANEFAKSRITAEAIKKITASIPDTWLNWPETDQRPESLRSVYFEFLFKRLLHSDTLTQYAENVRTTLI